MPTQVKICGLTRLEDVEAAVVAGADAVGFMFYERSPRRVTSEQAAELAGAAVGVRRVGVFVDPSEAEVRRVLAGVRLDVLQFHGNETPEFCARFAPLPVWKAFRVRDRETLSRLPAYREVAAWLLDSYVAGQPGGTGARFNWDLAIEAGGVGTAIVLAGGLTPENVAEAVRRVQPWGVDVSSGVESSPGVKDPALVRRFVEAVRGVDSRSSAGQ